MSRLWVFPFAWHWAGVGAWCAIALFTRWPMRGHSSLGGHHTGRAAAELLSEQGVLVVTLLLTTAVAAWIAFAGAARKLDVLLLCRILLCVWIFPALVPFAMLTLVFGPVIGIGMSPPLIMSVVASVGFALTALLVGWAPLKQADKAP